MVDEEKDAKELLHDISRCQYSAGRQRLSGWNIHGEMKHQWSDISLSRMTDNG